MESSSYSTDFVTGLQTQVTKISKLKLPHKDIQNFFPRLMTESQIHHANLLIFDTQSADTSRTSKKYMLKFAFCLFL